MSDILNGGGFNLKGDQCIKNVLFLCTGNSCRSQMAEAIVNHLLANRWKAFSAGTNPSGFVHPMVFEVLSEIGINHSGYSKSLDEIRGIDFDLVITVCDDAAENCPLWLGKGKREHMGFIDPAATEGNESERLTVFRMVRDEINTRIISFFSDLVRL